MRNFQLFLWHALLIYSLTRVVSICFKIVMKIMLSVFNKVRTELTEYIPFIVLLFPLISYIWRGTTRKYNRKIQQHRKKNNMSPYCKDMVEDFEDLADDLAPSSQYMKEGREAAQKVFEKLKQDGYKYQLKIGRTKIAGSFGKGTGISYEMEDGEIKNPDLDLIVVVNDEDPPFRTVFINFKKLLEDLDEVKSIHVRRFSVQLTISTPTQNYIKIDLLAATNFVKNTSAWPGQDVSDLEADFALLALCQKQIRSINETQTINQEKNKLYSSAFAEKTVALINDHVSNPFVLQVVRLAKYWNSGVEIPSPYAPARSCMIELIAIYTQRRRKGRGAMGERCVVSGFRRFLEAISKLKTLDITLTDGNNNSSGTEFRKYSKPMIRDPVNAWNNLAQGLNPVVIDTLVSQAILTLKMIQYMRRSVNYKSVENAIDEIFCHKE